MKHEILQFKTGLFEYYKDTVSGNKEITLDQARRKMTRNMLLAAKSDSSKYNGQKYKYGSLHFVVNERGVITWIKNSCYKPQGWTADKKLYVRLSKELGIEDAETIAGLHMRNITHELKHKYNWIRRGMTSNTNKEVELK